MTQSLLKSIYADYQTSVGLNPRGTYLQGTPIRPVVPLDTASGGVFILGAYPSSRFAVVSGVSDVPVADNLGPFENERWFDGARVRQQPSAQELDAHFLRPLGLSRDRCWITDLVKVFLFKPGHIQKYRRLGARAPAGYTRERFYELGRHSLPWIEKEVLAAKPLLLITLGAEVAGVMRGESRPALQVKFLVPEIAEATIGRARVAAIHCAHPGVLMRGDATSWAKRHASDFVPAIHGFLGSGDRQ